jgi:hypothetical protein
MATKQKTRQRYKSEPGRDLVPPCSPPKSYTAALIGAPCRVVTQRCTTCTGRRNNKAPLLRARLSLAAEPQHYAKCRATEAARQA